MASIMFYALKLIFILINENVNFVKHCCTNLYNYFKKLITYDLYKWCASIA